MATEPPAAEQVLHHHHARTNHHGIGNAQPSIACQTVATEDKASDDRLQQIVGQTHPTEDAQMVQHLAHTLVSIPRRNDGRYNHDQYGKIIDGLEPCFQLAEINITQHGHH